MNSSITFQNSLDFLLFLWYFVFYHEKEVVHMVRTKQVNSPNGAVLNRDFPKRSRSLIMVPEDLRRLYPNAKPEHIEMALPRSSPLLRIGTPRPRRTHEADSGMARTQRLFDYRKHLRALGLQLEAVFCRGNDGRVGYEWIKKTPPDYSDGVWRGRWDSNPRTGV